MFLSIRVRVGSRSGTLHEIVIEMAGLSPRDVWRLTSKMPWIRRVHSHVKSFWGEFIANRVWIDSVFLGHLGALEPTFFGKPLSWPRPRLSAPDWVATGLPLTYSFCWGAKSWLSIRSTHPRLIPFTMTSFLDIFLRSERFFDPPHLVTCPNMALIIVDKLYGASSSIDVAIVHWKWGIRALLLWSDMSLWSEIS